MILDVIQVSNELFSANFIINRGSKQTGSFFLQGRLGSMEAVICGNFGKRLFEMKYGSTDDLGIKYPFRPYIISENNIEHGTIYQTKYNGGLFNKFDYHQMKNNGLTFDLFPIGFGKEGSKSPIYVENKQIAQIEKECTVYNDLHNYRIYAKDDCSAYIAILFVVYMYINGGYKAGEKALSSTVKVVSTTTNKILKGKYNPDFKNSIEE